MSEFHWVILLLQFSIAVLPNSIRNQYHVENVKFIPNKVENQDSKKIK